MVSEPIPYKYERKRRGQQSKGGWDCKGRVGWMSVFTMGLGCHWESVIWVKIDGGERRIYKEIQGKNVLERGDNWNKGSKWELRIVRNSWQAAHYFRCIVRLDLCLFWAIELQSSVVMSWLEIGMAHTLLQIAFLCVVTVPTLSFLCIICEIQESVW